jgi:hypothetical protein
MDLLQRIKVKAQQKLSGVMNTLDRDKAMPGFQVTPGGISGGINRVQNMFQNAPRTMNVFDQVSSGNIQSGIKPLDQAGQFAGSYMKNWIVDPILDIPKNVNTVADPNKGLLERGAAGLMTAGALFPGDEAIWATLNAGKAKLAGRDPVKGFTGEEISGLGDAVTGGRDNMLAQGLNVAELPLLLAAGGIKAKNARKGMEPTVIGDILKNRKDIGTGMQFNTKRIADKYGYTENFVKKMLDRTKDTVKTERVLSYVNETPSVKNKEAYAIRALDTDFFQKKPGKTTVTKELRYEEPPPLTDADYKEGFFLDQKPNPVNPVNPVNTVNTKAIPVPEAPKPTKTFSPEAEAMRQVDYEKAKPEITQALDELESAFAMQKLTFEDVAQQRLDGKKNKNTKMLETWFDLFGEVAEMDGVEIPKTIKNYVTQLSPEKAKGILNMPQPVRSFGDALIEPYYVNKRTKVRTEPLTKEVLHAYAKESFNNRILDPVKKAEFQTAQKLAKEVKKTTDMQAITGGKQVEAVKTIQELGNPDGQVVVYDGKQRGVISKGLNSLLKGVDDRATAAGKQFYTDFVYPFKEANMVVNQAYKQLQSSSDAALKSSYQKEFGYVPSKVNRDNMITSLVLQVHKKMKAQAANTYMANVRRADFKKTWLADLADDVFDQYIARDLRLQTKGEKIMGMVRANTGRGALGLNLASAVNNIFETRRGFAAIDTRSMSKGLQRIVAGENFTQKYGVDSSLSTALERTKGAQGWRKQLENFDKGLFYMFDKSEKLKDQILLAGFEEQGIAKGLKGKDLNVYVLQKFSQFAVKYGKGQDIGLFRSPLVKTLAQFGQYAIKDAVITTEKTRGALKGDKGDISYMIKYVGTTIAQAMLFKQLLGTIGFGGSTSTAYDMYSSLADGELPFSPAVQSMLMLGQMAYDEFSGNELSEYDQTQRNKSLARSASVVGIPASNQIYYKTIKAFMNQDKGYQETFTGNVANPVSDKPWDRAKTLMFGPSYDPLRQDYIKRLQENEAKGLTGAGLTENESNLFRTLPKEERQPFYQQRISDKETKQANNAVIAELEDPKKPGFMQRVFGDTDKKAEITWGTTLTTPEEKKSHRNLVEAALSAGYEVPQEEITKAFFDGQSPTSSSIEEKTKGFSELSRILNSEEYSDEQKEAVLKASGAKRTDVDYYDIAGKTTAIKQQDLLEKLETMDTDELISFLASGKRSVAGKFYTNETMVNYLYDNDVISKEQREMLNALKFDEVNNRFYFTKAYRSKSGSKSRKISYSQAQSLFKTPLPKPSSINNINAFLAAVKTTQTSSSNDRLITDILNQGRGLRANKQDSWYAS